MTWDQPVRDPRIYMEVLDEYELHLADGYPVASAVTYGESGA
jgi:hypothetical protein